MRGGLVPEADGAVHSSLGSLRMKARLQEPDIGEGRIADHVALRAEVPPPPERQDLAREVNLCWLPVLGMAKFKGQHPAQSRIPIAGPP